MIQYIIKFFCLSVLKVFKNIKSTWLLWKKNADLHFGFEKKKDDDDDDDDDKDDTVQNLVFSVFTHIKSAYVLIRLVCRSVLKLAIGYHRCWWW